MPFTMSGNYDGWSYNRFNEFEGNLDESKKEGMHREADTGKVVDKAEVGKTYYPNMPKQKSSVALRKEKEAAEKSGIQYPKGEKKSFTKDKSDPKVAAGRKAAKEMGLLRKEELEATGMFSAEEIQAIVEASCGSKGYQEGGEVTKECEKCKGKGCDHCDGKGTHSKKEKGAKPDYLDFDKDGNKDEPMKDALKSKKD